MKASVTLFKSRQLINGEYSVKVRIFENGKYKHYDTGVSCKESNWNANKCRVSSKDIAYKSKNAQIEEVYKMYADEEQTATRHKNNEVSFYDLIALKKNKVKIGTKMGYGTLYNYMSGLYPNLSASAINQQWFDGFVSEIQKRKPKASARRYTQLFLAVYKYGIESGLIKTFTKLEWNPKAFNTEPKERILTATELNVLLYAYRQTQQNYEYLAEYNRMDKALMIWVLHFAFQGLAPIDMAYLKLKDLSIETLSTIPFDAIKAQEQTGYNEWYNDHNERIQVVTATLFRHKTGGKVELTTDYQSIKPILDYFTKDKTQDDYLIDCYHQDNELTEIRANERLHNYYVSQTKALNKYIGQICNLDVYKQQDIKVKHITYYSARHTFINKVASLNIDYNTIRRMIGHKTTVLERSYITEVTKIEQARVMRTILQPFTQIIKR